MAPSLAESWTTNYAAHVASPSTTKYEITFNLRPGVTFHDGEPWNAAAAKVNFDQIMGGTGALGGPKALKGMHDWMGFTQQLDGWSVVGDMTFKLSFREYYEAALRELAIIRPFRMISLAALPSMANGELSHNRFKGNGQVWSKGGFTMRGVAAPLGTGPYKAVHKLLGRAGSDGTYTLLAAGFNASCYDKDVYHGWTPDTEEGTTTSSSSSSSSAPGSSFSVETAEQSEPFSIPTFRAKLKALARCPAGFDWHRDGDGWRCNGGSHFVSNDDLPTING